jgi:hypothetical protein
MAVLTGSRLTKEFATIINDSRLTGLSLSPIIKHMFETALEQLAAAHEEFSALELTTLSRDQLLELLASLETDTRRRAAARTRSSRSWMRAASRPRWDVRRRRCCSPSGCESVGGRPRGGCA